MSYEQSITLCEGKDGWGKEVFIASFDPGQSKLGVLLQKRNVTTRKVTNVLLECADLKTDGEWITGLAAYLDKLDQKYDLKSLNIILIEKQNPIKLGRRTIHNTANVGVQHALMMYFAALFSRQRSPSPPAGQSPTHPVFLTIIQPHLKGTILNYPKKCDRITRKKAAFDKCLELLTKYGDTANFNRMNVTKGKVKYYDMADTIVQTEAYCLTVNL